MGNSDLCCILSTLPPEIHLAIASYLPFWDVYALRLTCRSLHATLPPLKQLPYSRYYKHYWMKEPLAASFLVGSNSIAVCNHCPNIIFLRNDFIKWVERGVWSDENKRYVRDNPLLPPEEWKLCLHCDRDWQDRQSNNWCCRWQSGLEPACSHCKPVMHRVYPGTETQKQGQMSLPGQNSKENWH